MCEEGVPGDVCSCRVALLHHDDRRARGVACMYFWRVLLPNVYVLVRCIVAATWKWVITSKWVSGRALDV